MARAVDAPMREDIIKRNMEFVYGNRRGDRPQDALMDPDKVSYLPSLPSHIAPEEDACVRLENDFVCLAPSFTCDVFHLSEYSNSRNGLASEKQFQSYPSFEHALLAAKLKDMEARVHVRSMESVRDVKRFISQQQQAGGDNAVIPTLEWSECCLSIAEALLRDKLVRHKEVRVALKKTGKKRILYVNDFGDLFWGLVPQNKSDLASRGADPGGKRQYGKKAVQAQANSRYPGYSGQNNLGLLLEKIRGDIDRGRDLDLWLDSFISVPSIDQVCIEVEVSRNNVVLTKEELGEQQLLFDKQNKLMIGKAEDNDFVTTHPSTSRSHALLAAADFGGTDTTCGVVVDLGSANGTFIGEQQLKPFVPVPITCNSKVRFGISSKEYRFELDLTAELRRKQRLIQKLADDPDLLTGNSNATEAEHTVFVRGLPPEVSDKEVREFFLSCGVITQLTVPRERVPRQRSSDDGIETGNAKGIAFVTFSSFSGVMQALARDGDKLRDRYLKVKKSDATKHHSKAVHNDSHGKQLHSQKHDGRDRDNYHALSRNHNESNIRDRNKNEKRDSRHYRERDPPRYQEPDDSHGPPRKLMRRSHSPPERRSKERDHRESSARRSGNDEDFDNRYRKSDDGTHRRSANDAPRGHKTSGIHSNDSLQRRFKRSEDDFEGSPSRRRSGGNPPRQRKNSENDVDESPSHRRLDASRPRRFDDDSDDSPPRRRPGDSRPRQVDDPRRGGRADDDSDGSPPRRQADDSDDSPPRRRPGDSRPRQVDDPRRGGRADDDSDGSPPRRRADDSDDSPPRRRPGDSRPRQVDDPRRGGRADDDSDGSPPRRRADDSDDSL